MLFAQDPCEAHRILYGVLFGWLRQQAAGRRKGDPAWQLALEEAQVDSRRQEVLEKERRTGRLFWNSHFDLLSKIDEVQSAAIRLQLAEDEADPLLMVPDQRKVTIESV